MKASPDGLFRLVFLSLLTLVIIIASFNYTVCVDGLITLKKKSMKRRQEQRARHNIQNRNHRDELFEQERRSFSLSVTFSTILPSPSSNRTSQIKFNTSVKSPNCPVSLRLKPSKAWRYARLII